MKNITVIGERLKDLRKQQDITQDEVADLLEVKRQTYSAYERNVSTPDAMTLKILAAFFGVTADYLLGSTNNPIPPSTAQPPDSFDGLSEDSQRELAKYAELLKLRDRAVENNEFAHEIKPKLT
jgi:transcriptional regulator with XRE-family HTH domain